MKADQTTVLNISHLNAGYGSMPVIKDFSLPPLETGLVALVGPNGAGKSTLLRALAQLISSQGSIRLDDADLMRMKPDMRSSLIGFMPQHLPDDISLTVLEAVIATLKVSGAELAGQRVEERALNVLADVGITDLASQPLNRLSGGQRQVASLAQAVASKPKLLLLDEPTSALDLARQFLIMRLAQSYARTGRIVVAVLHDLALAAQWADQIVVLAQGRLHSAGAPQEIITPQMLDEVYHIDARVEHCTRGQIRIMVDGVASLLSPVGDHVISNKSKE